MTGFEPGSLVRVVTKHSPEYPDPLVVRSGERVRVGKRSEDWPGWVWCTNVSGKGGWVPESYITVTGSAGILKEDYTTNELSAQIGEELKVESTESGWVWAVTRGGEHGWIPARNLTPLD